MNEGDQIAYLDHVNFKLGHKAGIWCLPTCGNGILEAGEVCDDTSDWTLSGCKDDCSGPKEEFSCWTINSKLSTHCL